MNAESFIQYIKQVSKLYQLPYQQLKSLAMQYPYFQNLHLLLALKSKLEEHPEYEKNLARASTYSNDRAKLYRSLTQLEKLAREDNVLLEDVLELEDINRIEKKLQSLELDLDKDLYVPEPKQAKQIDPFEDLMDNNVPVDEPHELIPDLLEEDLSHSEEPTIEKEENGIQLDLSVPEAISLPYLKIAKDIAAITGAVQLMFKNKEAQKIKKVKLKTLNPTLDIDQKKSELKSLQSNEPLNTLTSNFESPKIEFQLVDSTDAKSIQKPQPMPKQSFSSWVEQFQPAHVKPRLSELMEAKKKDRAKIQREEAPQRLVEGANLSFFAEKSIAENNEMASETLAELLVAQMQYKKAIKVYERLMLIFPEKSSFFADKIENLKKLIS